MNYRASDVILEDDFDDEDVQFFIYTKDKEIYEKKQRKQLLQWVQDIFNNDQQDEKLMLDKLEINSRAQDLDDIENENYQEYNDQIPQNPFMCVRLVPMNELQLAFSLEDNSFLYRLRKYIMIGYIGVQFAFKFILKSKLFQLFTLVVIIINSILIAVNEFAYEEIYRTFFTIEAGLKIVGFGVVLNQSSYFRDVWNVLDFVILIFSYPPMQDLGSFNFNALRTLRVLKSLEAAQQFPSLRSILQSLFQSFYQLKDAGIVLIFSYSIFAIVGLQLFSGVLKRRCMDIQIGVSLSDKICDECETGFVCAKLNENPNSNLTSFDTFGWSLTQVLIITTLGGWNTILEYVAAAEGEVVVLYFMIIVLVGGFFLVNLTLAIIKLNFSNNQNNLDNVEKQVESYDYWQLRDLDIYVPHRAKYTPKYGCEIPVFSRKRTKKLTRIREKTRIPTKQISQQQIKMQPMPNAKNFSKPFTKQNLIFQGIQGIGKKMNIVNLLTPSKRLQSQISQKSIMFHSPKNTDSLIQDLHLGRQTSSPMNSDLRSQGGFLTPFNIPNRPTFQRSTMMIQVAPELKLKDIQQHSFNLKSSKFKDGISERDLDKSEQSIIHSIPPEDIERQLMELGVYDDKVAWPIQVEQKKQSTIIYQRKKRSTQKRRTTYISSNNSIFDDKNQQLKLKLFKTQFQKIVINLQYQSESENDVLSISQGKRKKKEFLVIDQNIRKTKSQVTYKFSNQTTMFNSNLTQSSKRFVSSVKFSKDEQKNVKFNVFNNEKNQTKSKKQNKQITYLYAQKKFMKQIGLQENMEQQFGIIDKKNQDQYYYLDLIQRVLISSPFYDEYHNLIKQEIDLHNFEIQSSIEDVLKISQIKYLDSQYIQRMNSIIQQLNEVHQNINIWRPGVYGILLMTQAKISQLVGSQIFIQLINTFVALNTVVLSLDGLVNDDNLLQTFNIFFAIIFTIELILKIIGMGIKDFLRDKLNIFDAGIVAISLYEIFIVDQGGKSSFTVFRTVRIFRALRVLRISKLIRSLRFMGFLMKVLSNAFEQIIWLIVLMLFFLYTFTILGISLFQGQIQEENNRYNFNSFQSSFEVVFAVFTLSGWENILNALLLTNAPIYLSYIYLIVWIAIGNYVFLNLFLAVLLDNFESEYRQDKKQVDQNIIIGKEILFDQESQSQISKKTGKSSIQAVQDEYMLTSQKQFIYFCEFGLAERSLLIFSQENLFRRLCYRIVKAKVFDYAILILIFISSLKLILDTYPQNESQQNISDIIDIIMVILFSVESLMKIISFGFFYTENSYLKNSWNQADFIILIASIADISLSTIDLSFLKIIRLLRTLRPLRFVTHNKSMKILVSALLQSVDGIFNVSIVIILTWMMFAILGINLMKDKLYYCETNDGLTNYFNQDECQGIWRAHDTNFDNIFNGMLTLFVLSTIVNWPDFLLYFIDAGTNGPIKDNNPEFFWFFLFFILIGSILLINLFIGVILVNFHIAEESARDSNFTIGQIQWIDTQKLIIEYSPDFCLYYEPKQILRQQIFRLINSTYFDYSIQISILANIISIGMYMDDAPQLLYIVLDYLNIAFSVVFMFEAILKIIAFTPLFYFKGRWNQFDFLIVIVSIIDLLLNNIDIAIGNGFRILRAARLLRLVKQYRGLKKLIDTAIFSIPAILNAAGLYFLVHTIFSILGVFLFKDVRSGTIIDNEHTNFSDFHHSFLILFISQTGENWNLIMYDTMNAGSAYYSLFWVVFILIQNFVMLNLFILIILDQYDMNYFHEDNPLNRFDEFQLIFLKTWSKFSPDGECLHSSKLIQFILQLQKPLGLGLDDQLKQQIDTWKQTNPLHKKEELSQLRQIIRTEMIKSAAFKLMNMNLLLDEKGYLRFRQLLFALVKNSYMILIQNDVTDKGMKKMIKKELETKSKLLKEDEQYEFNPLLTYFHQIMSFRAWLRYSKKIKDISKGNNMEIEFQDSSIEFVDDLEAPLSTSSIAGGLPDYENVYFVPIPSNEAYKDQDEEDLVGPIQTLQYVNQSEDNNRFQYNPLPTLIINDFNKYLAENE